MIQLNKLLLLALIICVSSNSFSQLSTEQEQQIDSLKSVIDSEVHDSSKVNAIIAWDNLIYNFDIELDKKLNEQVEDICLDNLTKKNNVEEEEFFNFQLAYSYNNLGIISNLSGDQISSLEYYSKSLEIRKKLGKKVWIAGSHVNIGLVYVDIGRFPEAVKEFHKTIQITTSGLNEEQDPAQINKLQRTAADAHNGLGRVHELLGDYDEALGNFNDALELYEKCKHKEGIASSYNNLGLISSNKGDQNTALSYFLKSQKIKYEIGDLIGAINSHINVGAIYEENGEIDSAITELKKALDLSEQIGVVSALGHSNLSLGKLYKIKRNYSLSKKYALEALGFAQKSQNMVLLQSSYLLLSEIAYKTNDFKKAYEWRVNYNSYTDSVFTQEDSKRIIQEEVKHEYDLKTIQDSIEFVKAQEIDKLKIERQEADLGRNRTLLTASILGLLLVVIFSILLGRRLKISQTQKEIIEGQKLIVDAKNKEIHDSINYAERIQRSFLATEELLNENLGEHFVYFNPKEAVSGDFYWAGKLTNNNFAVSCADSTGHGVPGAIMSILNISSIERAVENKANKPAEIFNQARQLIIDRLKKDGSTEGGKDGMDASLISFNSEKTIMQYVAAHNPIWIIRSGELIDIKAEKMPVGKHDHDHIPFKGGEIELHKGDVIYTLTDGYQDQFGGEKGKKYKVKPFKRLLLKICDLPMNEQHQKISNTFDEWKGDLEQVDDVCVIGVRV